jgi:hypothetical protein
LCHFYFATKEIMLVDAVLEENAVDAILLPASKPKAMERLQGLTPRRKRLLRHDDLRIHLRLLNEILHEIMQRRKGSAFAHKTLFAFVCKREGDRAAIGCQCCVQS